MARVVHGQDQSLQLAVARLHDARGHDGGGGGGGRLVPQQREQLQPTQHAARDHHAVAMHSQPTITTVPLSSNYETSTVHSNMVNPQSFESSISVQKYVEFLFV